MDIRDLVREYGAKNLRIFIEEEDFQGLFPTFKMLRTEYKINTEHSDNPTGFHKICLTRVESNKPPEAPGWTDTIYNQYRPYISDLNYKKGVEVYVLVDEDNKYQRIA